jgi:hypothetical protein
VEPWKIDPIHLGLARSPGAFSVPESASKIIAVEYPLKKLAEESNCVIAKAIV